MKSKVQQEKLREEIRHSLAWLFVHDTISQERTLELNSMIHKLSISELKIMRDTLRIIAY